MRAASYLGVTMQGAPAPTPTPLPNATPPLERVVTPPSSNDIDWQSLLIAGFGATCALLTWLVVGALTGLGKVPSLLFPGAMLVALVGAVVGLTRAAVILWVLTAAALVAFCTIAMTSFVTRVLPTSAMVRRGKFPAPPPGAGGGLSRGVTPHWMLGSQAPARALPRPALVGG